MLNIEKHILNILVILILTLILIFIWCNNKSSLELFNTTSVTSNIEKYLQELSNLINQPKYSVITNIPNKNEGVYYNLNAVINKKTDILPTYRLYCTGPINNDIKHYTIINNEYDVSTPETRLTDLVKKSRDKSWYVRSGRRGRRGSEAADRKYIDHEYGVFRFTINNSGNEEKYYFNREFFDMIHNDFRNLYTGKIMYKSELLDVSAIINNIKNEIKNTELDDNLNKIFYLQTQQNFNTIEFSFKPNDKLYISEVNIFLNNLKTFVNNYKNLANIYLDVDYFGIFVEIDGFTFKLIYFDKTKIIYGIFTTSNYDLITLLRNAKYIQCYTRVSDPNKEFMVDNVNKEYDIRMRTSVMEYKWRKELEKAVYAFSKENNKYYFRRYLPYINGRRKTYNKRCDITDLLNKFINDFKKKIPVTYKSILPDVSSDGHVLKIIINL